MINILVSRNASINQPFFVKKANHTLTKNNFQADHTNYTVIVIILQNESVSSILD